MPLLVHPRLCFIQAVSLYKEALALVEQHSEDFCLDPLLNIHIHQNLAEILPLTPEYTQQFHSDKQSPKSLMHETYKICDEDNRNRDKISGEDTSILTINAENLPKFSSDQLTPDTNHTKEFEDKAWAQSNSSSIQCLKIACENLKHKFLSVFNSKLCLAQQEFKKSYAQVYDTLNNRKNQQAVWWLEALYHIEQNKESAGELIGKIGEVV